MVFDKRQGCTTVPELFNSFIDYLLECINERMHCEERDSYCLIDLEFADDIAFFAPNPKTLTDIRSQISQTWAENQLFEEKNCDNK